MAGAIAITGCGGSDNNASAPKQQKVTASGGSSGQPAAVSAKGTATPSSLCTAEGKGKPKKQCVKALGKLGSGKAANPKAACKGMSKKKTKGVRGKSPFAVCVNAAAKLMASKSGNGSGGGNGAADSNSSSDSGGDSGDGSGSSDNSSSEDTSGIVCHDENGKVVPIDSDEVADCDLPDDGASANDSSSGDSSSADDSSSDDSGDGG